MNTLKETLRVGLKHRIMDFEKSKYELGNRKLSPVARRSTGLTSSNGNGEVRLPPEFDVLEAALGEEGKQQFEAWWRTVIVEWFEREEPHWEDMELPTVEEALKEREALKQLH
jgi:hypothetical protein